MKKRRFLSIFLAFLLLGSLFASLARAEEAAAGPTLPPDPGVTANGALLIDLSADTVLYSKNAHNPMYPASLTKIMTCLLVLEAIDRGELTMDTKITASSIVTTLPADSSTAGIKTGEVLTIRELLYCLMVVSANESADILAEAVSGTVPAFIQTMNKRVLELGCTDTHFANPHGFHDDSHYMSPWDVAVITREAMKHPAFMTLCDTEKYVVPATNLSPERTLRTTNHLISLWRDRHYKNDEAHGIKTGSTSMAGQCLVASANRGGRQLLSVIMGAQKVPREDGSTDIRSFTETNLLFNWGFDNFQYKTLLEANTDIQEIAVELSKTDHVIATARDEIAALVPKSVNPEDLTRSVDFTSETLEAPVEPGESVGTLTLSLSIPEYGYTFTGSSELLTATGAELSKWMAFRRDAVDLVTSLRFRIGAGIAAGLVVALLIARAVTAGRRSRYGGGGASTRGNGYRGKKR